MLWEYVYKCWDCDSSETHLFESRKPARYVDCIECGRYIEQDYTAKNVRPDVFEAYLEENAGFGKVQVNTRQERDDLCDQNHVTYDKRNPSQARGPQRTPWEKDLTWQRVQNMDGGDHAAMAEEQELAKRNVEDLPE